MGVRGALYKCVCVCVFAFTFAFVCRRVYPCFYCGANRFPPPCWKVTGVLGDVSLCGNQHHGQQRPFPPHEHLSRHSSPFNHRDSRCSFFSTFIVPIKKNWKRCPLRFTLRFTLIFNTDGKETQKRDVRELQAATSININSKREAPLETLSDDDRFTQPTEG